MRKKVIAITITLIAIVAILATGCGISKTDYNAVARERDQARSQVTSLQNEVAAAKEQITTLEEEVSALREGTVIPELEEKVASLESELSAAEQQVTTLEEQVSVLEGRINPATEWVDLLSWHVTPQEELDLTGLMEEWQTKLQERDDAQLSAMVEELEAHIESKLAEGLTEEEVAASPEYGDVRDRISNHIIQKVATALKTE